ncbi:hypothetical protein [Proteiniphilum sp. X52]|nr:hypothetical protein [Proteiniphilum sp. X52]
MKVNQEEKEGKEAYEKPAIAVIEMETEGILCASGTGPGFEPGGEW